MTSVMIDGYNLALSKGTGVATYARNLSHEIENLGHEVFVVYGNRASSTRDPLLREISFFDSNETMQKGALHILDQTRHAISGPMGQTAVEVPITGKVIANAFKSKMPSYSKVYNAPDCFKRSQSGFKLWSSISPLHLPVKPDLAHWTYPLPIRIKGRPNIYTLHDLVPLRLPYTTLDHKRYYLKLMRKLAQTADHIVTVSESSRKDIIEILGIRPERITNTYQSVEIPAHLREKSDDQVAREVEGLAGVGFKDYFLFWGSIEPKKNIGRMIEAYMVSKVTAPLLIVGAQAWRSAEELRLLDRSMEGALGSEQNFSRSKKRIIRMPYAPFGLLVSLIRGAKAALFPSLYEGFGLPALEAMTLGTPVICSNTASLPEVVGDAALTVDPYDTAALAAAIHTVDADADLREELRQQGLKQAEKFTAKAYQERLHSVYQRYL